MLSRPFNMTTSHQGLVDAAVGEECITSLFFANSYKVVLTLGSVGYRS